MEAVPESEAFIVSLLGPMMDLASNRLKPVQDEASVAVKAVAKVFCSDALSAILPTIFKAMEYGQKWQTRVVALEFLAGLADHAPEQLGILLPDVVPLLTPCMSDTKKQVKEAAIKAMTAVCDVIGNKDMEHFTVDIVRAIINPKDVPEIMHTLAGVRFVQSVESPALAITVPLLLRGLREKSTATRRQSAVIIENMSKLVDVPMYAAPFLPLLMPALEKAAKTISDPEARGVADRAYTQLMRLNGPCKASHARFADSEEVSAAVSKIDGIVENEALAVSKSYLVSACTLLMRLKRTSIEGWKEAEKLVLPLLSDASKVGEVIEKLCAACSSMMEEEEEADEDDAEDLCNSTFTLAYGTKILLHNTKMRLKRGKKYGLLGGNDSGKSTLMRAIANGSVEGFPDASEVKTVFVESDIQGEQSHLSCVEYVLTDDAIKACGASREAVLETLNSVGFVDDGKAKPHHAVSTLSGGWRMKLALARAMLQHADILLLDEPTNHLDVINVAWVKNYINGLTEVTAIMVSHDSGFLNDCCTHILSIESLKLHNHKGNLNDFVKTKPSAKPFFELKATKNKFTFPQPGPIEGIKSKGRALLNMTKATFTYANNETPTLFDITVQVSLSSRVACVGENGAGKSTMIKCLTGEAVPQTGEVWRHPNARVAYLAQHAFHHIENHLSLTPNEYIRWRYANNGEDKESLVKVSMVATEEEEELRKTPFEIQWVDEASGKAMKVKKSIMELVGGRRQDKSKTYTYNVTYVGGSGGAPEYLNVKELKRQGWEKAVRAIDARLAQTSGLYVRPLSSSNVEKHLADCGLIPEFATHTRIGALSGGQKVKVVLAAAMWNQPHILILDEPTNYLDRDSLGALALAIDDFQGGVVIISHNNEFVSTVCPEEWVMDAGHLETRGEAGWMERQDDKIDDQVQVQEMVDAAGNVTMSKGQKKKMSKKETKTLIKKLRAKIDNDDALDTDEDEFATEHELYKA